MTLTRSVTGHSCLWEGATLGTELSSQDSPESLAVPGSWQGEPHAIVSPPEKEGLEGRGEARGKGREWKEVGRTEGREERQKEGGGSCIRTHYNQRHHQVTLILLRFKFIMYQGQPNCFTKHREHQMYPEALAALHGTMQEVRDALTQCCKALSHHTAQPVCFQGQMVTQTFGPSPESLCGA